jgi:biopolymer transport protein ExbB
MGKMRWLMAGVTILGGGVHGVLAATAGAAEPTLEVGRYMSLAELFEKGGSLMYVLAALSVIALALVIYCFIVMRAEAIVSRVFRRDLVAKINSGAWDDVRTACQYRPSPLAEIALAALDSLQAGGGKTDPSLLKEIIESEGSRQAATIQNEPQYILDVAVIAPMVGLLGTVFGMIQAFNVVALDLAKAKPMLLAAGVSEALITTAGGLIIGIPAMAFYAFFRGRANQLVGLLESAGHEVLTAFMRASQR